MAIKGVSTSGACSCSQQHEGWVCLPKKYDDGGFSGGSMDRPALKRLMDVITAGKVDCVVAYRSRKDDDIRSHAHHIAPQPFP